MFFPFFTVFPWHWAQVSLPILRISMTLSVHCHICPLCCPSPPAVPASSLGVLSGCCGEAHRAPFPCPFSDLHQTPYFPKGTQEKGQLAKAVLVVVSVRQELSCSKRGLWSSEDNWSISFPWACSFWAHTPIYTGIFLSLSVSVTPVFHHPCIH